LAIHRLVDAFHDARRNDGAIVAGRDSDELPTGTLERSLRVRMLERRDAEYESDVERTPQVLDEDHARLREPGTAAIRVRDAEPAVNRLRRAVELAGKHAHELVGEFQRQHDAFVFRRIREEDALRIELLVQETGGGAHADIRIPDAEIGNELRNFVVPDEREAVAMRERRAYGVPLDDCRLHAATTRSTWRRRLAPSVRAGRSCESCR